MLALPDYTLGKCLRASMRSEVYAAVRHDDGVEVVLKHYLHDTFGRGDSRAARELQALHASAGVGVPRALELVPAPRSPVLVLEWVPGVSFAQWVAARMPSAEEFLEVAVQLAEALVRIHAARLIHRDLNPENVLVDPATRRAHVIDFGLARELGASSRGDAMNSGTETGLTALRYVAPEQTGRMDRGIDSRSDLYSFGALLYLALAGRAPFELQDALALVHAHIALVPRPPGEYRLGVHSTLSRIVLKLLQKEPEERYQTAAAVLTDLQECRAQLQRTGTIDERLPLATADSPGRPLFIRKLHGRTAEVQALRDAFGRSAQGNAEIVRLSGLPGAGKSALVDELRRELAERGGYLAAGKFDLYRRDVPYSGFAAALGSLAQLMLTESEERLQRWRARLLGELGGVAGVVGELVPDLGIVLGPVTAAAPAGPRETQARLALALQRLVRACAAPEHPLVLFLDDLQWADPGSRFLLEEIIVSCEKCALLLIAAYRDSDTALLRPLETLWEKAEASGRPSTQIALRPLDVDAAAQMIGDALSSPPERARRLAERVTLKTEGNPLLIQQFVLHMHALGLLRFAPGAGWSWDDAAIAAADIPEGAVALMVAKLERLEAPVREVIELASCVGDQFDAALLAELSGREKEVLNPPLFRLAEEGLIAPCPAGLRFVHDRIREAAQALLSESSRAELHHRTARLLLARTTATERAERAFEIADHLNHALERLDEPERCDGLAINHLAGRRALAAGAAATASAYLASARSLLRPQDWARDGALCFALFDDAAEAAYQVQDYPLSLQLLDALEAQPLGQFERAVLEGKRLRTLLHVDGAQVLERTLRSLRSYGVRWPLRPSWLRVRIAIAYTDWCLRRPLAENLFPPAPPRDPAWIAPIVLIGAGGAALQGHSVRLVFLATAYVLRRYIRYGTVPGRGPSFALAAYASYRLTLLGRLQGAQRLAEATEVWMERRPSSSIDARARFDLLSFVRTWLDSLHGVVEPLRALSETLREAGDHEFWRYAVTQHVSCMMLCGERLEVVQTRIQSLAEPLKPADRLVFLPYERPCELLRSGGLESLDLAAELALRQHEANWLGVSQNRSVLVHWVQLLCVFGRFADALKLCNDLLPSLAAGAPPGAYRSHIWMLDGLSSAALAERQKGAPRRASLRRVRARLSELRRFADLSADVLHMQHGLEAELAALRGHTSLALRHYQDAAKRADQRGYRQHAALFYERRANLLHRLRRETEAAQDVKKALQRYRDWGAEAKVRELEPAQQGQWV